MTEIPRSIRLGSAVLIRGGRGDLLVGRRGVEPYKGYWCFPGGGVQVGETIEEAAKREAQEETGLAISLSDFIGVFEWIQPEDHRVTVFHWANAVGGELKAGSDLEALWWIEQRLLRQVPMAFAPLALMALGKVAETP